MLLQQIAANDATTKEVLDRVLQYSPLLRNHVQFYSKPGDSSTGRKQQGAFTASSRSLDNKYTEKETEPEWVTATRKFIGDTIRVDVARERMGFDIASETMAQLLRTAPGIATRFHKLLISGNPANDAETFKGLEIMAKSSQTTKLATNGMQVLTGNSDNAKSSQQAFLEAIDYIIATTKGINKVVIGNGKTIARLGTIAREYIKHTKDSFGKPIVLYNNIPLVNIEDSGDTIIPFAESCGTSNDCASLYCTSFEEEAGLSFLTTEDGFKVYDPSRVSNWYETMVELIADSALFRDEAVSRLAGIKI